MANEGKAQCSKCGTFCKAASVKDCTTVLPDGQTCGGCLIPTYMVQHKGKATQVYEVSATSDRHLSCCSQMEEDNSFLLIKLITIREIKCD